MAEWSKARDSKSRIPQGIQGSNPCLSARLQSGASLIAAPVQFLGAPLDTPFFAGRARIRVPIALRGRTIVCTSRTYGLIVNA
jgi:hypothetical protein